MKDDWALLKVNLVVEFIDQISNAKNIVSEFPESDLARFQLLIQERAQAYGFRFSGKYIVRSSFASILAGDCQARLFRERTTFANSSQVCSAFLNYAFYSIQISKIVQGQFPSLPQDLLDTIMTSIFDCLPVDLKSNASYRPVSELQGFKNELLSLELLRVKMMYAGASALPGMLFSSSFFQLIISIDPLKESVMENMAILLYKDIETCLEKAGFLGNFLSRRSFLDDLTKRVSVLCIDYLFYFCRSLRHFLPRLTRSTRQRSQQDMNSKEQSMQPLPHIYKT